VTTFFRRPARIIKFVTAEHIQRLARDCGFLLAGVARAEPLAEDNRRYLHWVERGLAGAMGYLTGRRAAIRTDPRLLLPSARSIIVAGMLYNGPEAHSTEFSQADLGWISRYAWGDDYHDVLRRGLEKLAEKLGAGHEHKICVDTAPLLERSYARAAGLGWIGKNTCLINQEMGSWFFLGEILTSLEIEAGAPPPDRCGVCTRCIEACPTGAIASGGYEIDARSCISYFTIELRGPVPEYARAGIGAHVFGCDICQDVCPWNRQPPFSTEPAFAPRHFAPPLEKLAALSEDEFREVFRSSPVQRARYTGFLRNVAIAMGNSRRENFREPLEKLAALPNPTVAEHARWALDQLPVRMGS
jgi:epoxyqueuosine reductase